MSRLLGKHAQKISPYVPGEQPQDKAYIKLNTNESPYPPSPLVKKAVAEYAITELRRYPDPTATALRTAVAQQYGLSVEQVFAGGGSDEVLAYCFMAFADKGDKVYFPDITYGFYKVYADLFEQTAVRIPLTDSFLVNPKDYTALDGNIYIANPNAPTGVSLSQEELEEILRVNRERLVVIDEAYVDFSAKESCVGLVNQYDNLIVVQTFSKSRALAGMRLGFAFGNPELMQGLERIKYSFNPYNLDPLSIAVGIAAVEDGAYLSQTVQKIVSTRETLARELSKLGFIVIPSEANFLFTKHPNYAGEQLYEELRKRGVLVRHFGAERIKDFIRITIGTDVEMTGFLQQLQQVLNQWGNNNA